MKKMRGLARAVRKRFRMLWGVRLARGKVWELQSFLVLYSRYSQCCAECRLWLAALVWAEFKRQAFQRRPRCECLDREFRLGKDRRPRGLPGLRQKFLWVLLELLVRLLVEEAEAVSS